ncbi:MAG: LPS-assembly protein LptD [Chitinivibrionales bacterium]|nr:LPS-assembly protein LptD [Chitinivibrionales bacterium]
MTKRTDSQHFFNEIMVPVLFLSVILPHLVASFNHALRVIVVVTSSVAVWYVISAATPSATAPTSTAPLSNSAHTSGDSLPMHTQTTPSQADSSTVRGDTTTSQTTVQDTVHYGAEIIEYDIAHKIILLRNHATVTYKDMILYADTIHFLSDQNLLLASGQPQLIQGRDTLAGRRMVYNLRTDRGKIIYGTARSLEEKYNGTAITRTKDKTIYFENGDYTSCAIADSSHYYFYGKNIKIIPSDKMVARPFILTLGNAPIAWLPYFALPLRTGRQSGWLIPKWGGNLASGGHFDNIGYYWAPNDYVDASAAINIYEFSKYLFTATTNYCLRYWLSGNVNMRYSFTTSSDTLNRLWSLDYNHNQNLLPDESMKLIGHGSIVSGRNFYQSFSEDTSELLNQEISATMALSKNFKQLNASGAMTWNRLQNFKTNITDQDLPSFSFSLYTRPLISRSISVENGTMTPREESGDRWYHSIAYSYSIVGNNKFTETKTDGQNSKFHHSGLMHSIPLTASGTFAKWFRVSPSFTIAQAFYDAYIDTTGHIDTVVTILKTKSGADSTVKKATVRYDTTSWWDNGFHPSHAQVYSWNTGISFSTTLYGLFPIKMFSLNGVRHTLTPSISYIYYPKTSINGDKNYPQISGIGVSRQKETAQNISFALANLFQGRLSSKDAKKESSDRKFTLVDANISASYNFLGKPTKWSDIGVSASIPNQFSNISTRATFRPYDINNSLAQYPHLMSWSFDLSPRFSGYSGTLWGGDFLILEGLNDGQIPKNPSLNQQKPGWNLNLGPSYGFSMTRSTVQEDFRFDRSFRLSTSAQIKFTDIWSVSWSSSYDFTANQFMNHTLNFYCDRECWDLQFNWNPTGFNSGSFYFIMKIKKHPEVKWDRRDTDR